jgi:NADPH:quinone reductase-like Zn-dependent oxidoreductase
MRAALVTRYGPPNVVTVGEAPKPAPGADEVLIRVHAASVNRTDCGELRGHPFLHAPLHAVLERIGLRSGRDIMVYGASGAIASAMVQLAKAAGARVTAVVATARLELVWSLGADRALDDTAGDFTLIGETFDAVGKTSFFRCRKLLRPGGIYAATDLGPGGQNLALVIWSAVV